MADLDFRPRSQQRKHTRPSASRMWIWTAVIAVAAAGGGWYYWKQQEPATAVPAAPVSAPPAAAVPEVAPASAPLPEPEAPAPEAAAARQELQHPLPQAAADALQAQDAQGLEQIVSDWLGRASALKFVALQGLAHHIVATIDNLPRSHAAPRLWPLYPVGGRMITTSADGGPMQIAADNSSRYDAVAGFVAGIDAAQAAALYRRAYPVLQQAYEELGYPGKYFNDRLVSVIDHLLQTPEPQGPLVLKLVQVQGSVAPQQPWLRYELADAQLQSLSAGQKILLRMGPEHARTVKAQLRALRSHIAADKR